jgi:hypothetical protein
MRKAANVLGDVWALSPDQRLIGKPLHALFQLLDKSIGVLNLISSNFHPDIGQITLGGFGELCNLQLTSTFDRLKLRPSRSLDALDRLAVEGCGFPGIQCS